jgi:hypothetical protein
MHTPGRLPQLPSVRLSHTNARSGVVASVYLTHPRLQATGLFRVLITAIPADGHLSKSAYHCILIQV